MMHRYQFEFSENGQSSFLSLSKEVQRRILKKLFFWESLENPLRFAKKLVGFENRFRFRIGDYLVIIACKDQFTVIVLVVLKVAHRREVYE